MKILFILLTLINVSVFAQVSVKGYYRKNGTYVQPHQRTRPNGTITDNYSYRERRGSMGGSSQASNITHPQKSLKRYKNSIIRYETYTHPITRRSILIEYVEEYSIEKNYEGVMTPMVVKSKQSYTPVTTPYPVKVNKMARFYVTYDRQNRGEQYEPFLNNETMVEVVGRDKDRLYLVKYKDREGFLKEADIDSIVIRKIDHERLKKEEEEERRYGIIDTTNYAYGIVSAELSLFRDSPETKSENIIDNLKEGSIIKVIAYHSNDFWVVKYNDKLGFMIDAFFRLLSDKEVNSYLQGGHLEVRKKRKKGLFGRNKRNFNDTDDTY